MVVRLLAVSIPFCLSSMIAMTEPAPNMIVFDAALLEDVPAADEHVQLDEEIIEILAALVIDEVLDGRDEA